MVEGAVFIMAAFNGYLEGIAPPETTGGLDARHSVGLASFFALLVFLIVKMWASFLLDARRSKLWAIGATMMAITFAVTAWSYASLHRAATFSYATEPGSVTIVLRGSKLTAAAAKLARQIQDTTGYAPQPQVLVQKLARTGLGSITEVWTEESLRSEYDRLLRRYLLLIVSLSLGLAMCAEAIVGSSKLRAPAQEIAPGTLPRVATNAPTPHPP